LTMKSQQKLGDKDLIIKEKTISFLKKFNIKNTC